MLLAIPYKHHSRRIKVYYILKSNIQILFVDDYIQQSPYEICASRLKGDTSQKTGRQHSQLTKNYEQTAQTTYLYRSKEIKTRHFLMKSTSNIILPCLLILFFLAAKPNSYLCSAFTTITLQQKQYKDIKLDIPLFVQWKILAIYSTMIYSHLQEQEQTNLSS